MKNCTKTLKECNCSFCVLNEDKRVHFHVSRASGFQYALSIMMRQGFINLLLLNKKQLPSPMVLNDYIQVNSVQMLCMKNRSHQIDNVNVCIELDTLENELNFISHDWCQHLNYKQSEYIPRKKEVTVPQEVAVSKTMNSFCRNSKSNKTHFEQDCVYHTQ